MKRRSRRKSSPQAAEPDPSRLAATRQAPQDEADDTIEENGSAAETGRASWYDLETPTASGEQLDDGELTAAHRSAPFGTKLRVVNLKNGREVVVRVNDRGPFAKDRIIDLSKAAAMRLGMIADGVANVSVTPVADQLAGNSGAGGYKRKPGKRPGQLFTRAVVTRITLMPVVNLLLDLILGHAVALLDLAFSWSRRPLICVRSSSVSLPHFSLTWPLTCFQLPSTRFQSMATS